MTPEEREAWAKEKQAAWQPLIDLPDTLLDIADNFVANCKSAMNDVEEKMNRYVAEKRAERARLLKQVTEQQRIKPPCEVHTVACSCTSEMEKELREAGWLPMAAHPKAQAWYAPDGVLHPGPQFAWNLMKQQQEDHPSQV